VTERKRTERTLRESEDRFRTLADNMAQLAWMADESGWIFWYNRRWFNYTGTTLEEMQGGGWQKVHHPDHLNRVVEKFRRSIATGEVWEDTFPLRGKDGHFRWFLSRAIPIRDKAGRVLRWFGTNTDVTEQREAEESLKEADRRKDEFLAMLAHELRNPLAPIRNAVQVMGAVGPQQQDLHWARAVVDRQVQHLGRLVDDLLDVSRISRGKIKLQKEPVELSEVVARAVETTLPFIENKRHELSVVMPTDPVRLEGDPVRLAQVLGNLLNNAAKYTDEGGRIELLGRHEGDHVVLR